MRLARERLNTEQWELQQSLLARVPEELAAPGDGDGLDALPAPGPGPAAPWAAWPAAHTDYEAGAPHALGAMPPAPSVGYSGRGYGGTGGGGGGNDCGGASGWPAAAHCAHTYYSYADGDGERDGNGNGHANERAAHWEDAGLLDGGGGGGGSSAATPLLAGGEAYEWAAPANLDLFFTRVYRYWHERGLRSILLAGALNLLALAFTAAFSTFLLLFVDWSALHTACLAPRAGGGGAAAAAAGDGDAGGAGGAGGCDLLSVGLDRRPLLSRGLVPGLLAVCYVGLCVGYLGWSAAHWVSDVGHMREVGAFMASRLGISEAKVVALTWAEVVHRLVLVQRTSRLCIARDLDELGIVARIMRKENYLIAMINRNVLQLHLTLPHVSMADVAEGLTAAAAAASTAANAAAEHVRHRLARSRVAGSGAGSGGGPAIGLQNGGGGNYHNHHHGNGNGNGYASLAVDSNGLENGGGGGSGGAAATLRQRLLSRLGGGSGGAGGDGGGRGGGGGSGRRRRRCPPMLTKTLEWNLRWCILDHMFDDRFRIRPEFLDVAALRRRLRVVAAANLLLSPFLSMFLLAYFFMRNAERLYHHPAGLGSRRWSGLAKWRLRELNELPHYLHHRLSASHPAALRYVAQFPSHTLAAVARFAVFVTGSFVALLLFMTFLDEGLLERPLAGRQVVWWLGTLTLVLAACRNLVSEEPVAYDPERALAEVVAYTHYLPRAWRGRAHTAEVQSAFLALFRLKVGLFCEELLSLLATPLVLAWSLPECAESIVEFVSCFTVHVPGLGDVCSLALFDDAALARHGNAKYGAPVQADKAMRSRQGKLEKSFLTFAATYPTWSPGELGRRMLATLAAGGGGGGGGAVGGGAGAEGGDYGDGGKGGDGWDAGRVTASSSAVVVSCGGGGRWQQQQPHQRLAVGGMAPVAAPPPKPPPVATDAQPYHQSSPTAFPYQAAAKAGRATGANAVAAAGAQDAAATAAAAVAAGRAGVAARGPPPRQRLPPRPAAPPPSLPPHFQPYHGVRSYMSNGGGAASGLSAAAGGGGGGDGGWPPGLRPQLESPVLLMAPYLAAAGTGSGAAATSAATPHYVPPPFPFARGGNLYSGGAGSPSPSVASSQFSTLAPPHLQYYPVPYYYTAAQQAAAARHAGAGGANTGGRAANGLDNGSGGGAWLPAGQAAPASRLGQPEPHRYPPAQHTAGGGTARGTAAVAAAPAGPAADDGTAMEVPPADGDGDGGGAVPGFGSATASTTAAAPGCGSDILDLRGLDDPPPAAAALASSSSASAFSRFSGLGTGSGAGSAAAGVTSLPSSSSHAGGTTTPRHIGDGAAWPAAAAAPAPAPAPAPDLDMQRPHPIDTDLNDDDPLGLGHGLGHGLGLLGGDFVALPPAALATAPPLMAWGPGGHQPPLAEAGAEASGLWPPAPPPRAAQQVQRSRAAPQPGRPGVAPPAAVGGSGAEEDEDVFGAGLREDPDSGFGLVPGAAAPALDRAGSAALRLPHQHQHQHQQPHPPHALLPAQAPARAVHAAGGATGGAMADAGAGSGGGAGGVGASLAPLPLTASMSLPRRRWGPQGGADVTAAAPAASHLLDSPPQPSSPRAAAAAAAAQAAADPGADATASQYVSTDYFAAGGRGGHASGGGGGGGGGDDDDGDPYGMYEYDYATMLSGTPRAAGSHAAAAAAAAARPDGGAAPLQGGERQREHGFSGTPARGAAAAVGADAAAIAAEVHDYPDFFLPPPPPLHPPHQLHHVHHQAQQQAHGLGRGSGMGAAAPPPRPHLPAAPEGAGLAGWVAAGQQLLQSLYESRDHTVSHMRQQQRHASGLLGGGGGGGMAGLAGSAFGGGGGRASTFEAGGGGRYEGGLGGGAESFVSGAESSQMWYSVAGSMPGSVAGGSVRGSAMAGWAPPDTRAQPY